MTVSAAIVGACFLSRLCGGEELLRLADWLVDFLSRLCGGEDFERYQQWDTEFLSRLCGGEY